MEKLVIVCGSPSSEMAAPFEDPDYQVWVLGNRCDKYPRFDVIFEIHDDLTEHKPGYAKWLADKNVPMVVGEAFPIKAGHIETFPFSAAKELFGSTYLTSSSAYMLALGLLRGFTHIELYGVDMAVDDHEYFWQRPCMEAWIGFAKGRGVTVIVPEVSPVLKSDYIEGKGRGGRPDFSKPPFTQAGFLEIAGLHQSKIDHIESQIQQLKMSLQGHTSARDVYNRLAKVARAVEAGQTINSLTDTVALR